MDVNSRLKKLPYILGSFIVVLPLYIFLHELGHTIVILSAGGKITDFSILTAHVSSVDGEYTDISDLWLNANGAFFPVVIAYLYALFYKKDIKNLFYRFFSFFLILTPCGSLLAWVIIPFAYIQGKAPAGDDVTKFLSNFAQTHSPLIVSAAAAGIIIIGVVIMIRKGILRNYIEEIRFK